MDSHHDYKIPLSELLAILKADGYEVSIERILEIQSALLSTPVSRLSLSQLKYIITPVLARSDEDQNNIYKIIDRYISDKTKPDVKKAVGVKALFRNKRFLFTLKIAGYVLIVTAAVLVYLLQKKPPQKNTIAKAPPVVTQPVNPSKNTPQVNSDKEKRPKPKKAVDETIRPVYSKPITPTRINIILPLACAFGLGFGGILYYIIFFERKKRMDAKKNEQENETSPASKESRQRANLADQPEYATVQFQSKDFLIQKNREFSTIRANLKKPVLVEKVYLDVKKSVLATTRNAGFATLEFNNQWKERKYLILIDHKREDAHINHLLGYFTRFLTSSKIPVAKYTYTTDIELLKDKSHKDISLEELSDDLSDHHLIIIGDGHSFFDADTRLMKKELAAVLDKWSDRSVITPVPLPDWLWHEEQFHNNFYHIVTAEISAIELLSKAIADGSVIHLGKLYKGIRDKYSVSKYNLSKPEQLKEYLNNKDLFQLICSLAVYPRLNWNITLALFAAMMKRESAGVPATKPDYDTLLKISRIPWMNDDRMDDSLRLQLLDHLEPQTEIIARETILELLKETQAPKDSPAANELRVQVAVNSFFLYAHDQQRYKQYENVKKDFLNHWNKLDEPVLKQRSANGLMPLNNHGQQKSVEEFVLQEEQFEKRNVTFLRIVLLTLPAALLYILFTLFRPAFTYADTYEKISLMTVIRKDSSCQKELTRVIVHKPDKFDTTILKANTVVNYIPIENIAYNNSIYLSFLFADGSDERVQISTRDSIADITVKCR